MTTTDKFKILTKFVKDLSSETADAQTYLFVKDNISKYHLNIEIKSKPVKNQLIEISAILKFQDSQPNERQSYFEITYVSIVKVDDDVKEKKDLEKNNSLWGSKENLPRLRKSIFKFINWFWVSWN